MSKVVHSSSDKLPEGWKRLPPPPPGEPPEGWTRRPRPPPRPIEERLDILEQNFDIIKYNIPYLFDMVSEGSKKHIKSKKKSSKKKSSKKKSFKKKSFKKKSIKISKRLSRRRR